MKKQNPDEEIDVTFEVTPAPVSQPSLTLTNALLICILILNIIGLYFLAGYTLKIPDSPFEVLGIRNALRYHEYEKVGGKENYELQNEVQRLSLYDSQYPGNIENMKKYISSFESGTVQNPTTPPDVSSSLDVDALVATSGSIVATIVDDTVVEGNTGATITVVEYSDMECPFCMRQFHQTRLKEKLFAQYGDTINFVFKNHRGVNHAGTEAKAIAALCAQKVGGATAYVRYYTAVMTASTGNNNLFPVASLPVLAEKLGLDMTAWNVCYSSKETLAIFQKQTDEGMGYNLTGTPGTRIINNKTGKSDVVEGAYPYETFTEKIDNLLK